MTERNDQGREIWFSRIAWSYMPAHWKGVVYPMAIIAAIGPFVALAINYDNDLMFIPLLIGWALAMWICERHSPSRN